MPVEYKGIWLDCGYRLDFLVEGSPILELKSVDEISGIPEAQLPTHMKKTRIRTGFADQFQRL